MRLSDLRKPPPARPPLGRDDGILWLPASRVRPTARGDRLVLSLCLATASVLAAAAGIAAFERRSDAPMQGLTVSSFPKGAERASAPPPVQPPPAPRALSAPAFEPAAAAVAEVVFAPPAATMEPQPIPPTAPLPEFPPGPAPSDPALRPAVAPRPEMRPPVREARLAPGETAAVYLDAYPDQKAAAAALKTAQAKYGPYIGANRLTYTRRNGAGWRLRVGNLDPAAAEAICAKVKAAGQTCGVGPN